MKEKVARKFKKLNMFRSYDSNPSVCDLKDVIRVGGKVVAGEILYRNIDEEGVDVTKRAPGKEVKYLKDDEPFLKMYFNNSSLMMTLPSIGVDMFCYVISLMKGGIGKDCVTISKSGFAAFSGKVSDVSYYNGISSLLEAKILYKMIGEDNTFYVNVRVMFNGSRENLFKKYYGDDLTVFDKNDSHIIPPIDGEVFN
jgi:hypothetical protein